MDPDANLAELLKLAAKLQDFEMPPYSGGTDEHDVHRLCELVTALDEWITKGGFLPARWRNDAAGR